MSANSAEVRYALINRLSADPTLTSLLPDGVYFGTAPLNRQRFLFLRLEGHHDDPMQPGAVAFEVFTFLIKAVIQDSSILDADAAALRVMELLNYQDLAITGYGLANLTRTEDIAFNEVDQANRFWQHAGGVYELWVSPTTP